MCASISTQRPIRRTESRSRGAIPARPDDRGEIDLQYYIPNVSSALFQITPDLSSTSAAGARPTGVTPLPPFTFRRAPGGQETSECKAGGLRFGFDIGRLLTTLIGFQFPGRFRVGVVLGAPFLASSENGERSANWVSAHCSQASQKASTRPRNLQPASIC